MSKIDVSLEQEVAAYFQSLGINQGPGDVQYRLIILALASNEGRVTLFSDIRAYTDQIADRGSVASKLKTVFLLEGLAKKVQRGGYVITDRGVAAARFIEKSTKFYRKSVQIDAIIERIP
ncbi:MAG: hypothetical protein U9N07_05360 [Euryarchaeota archaeon]|nr:hypothetical protein [Euryarchaeota archaeon]